MKTANLPHLAGILLCLALSLTACKQPGQPPPDSPRLTPNTTMVDVTFHSQSLGRDMPYRLIYPKNGPKEGFASGKKFPVVYLLHGGGGGFRDWSNDSDIARFAERGVILVMPEGESSHYTNAADRRWDGKEDRFEDYIAHDLIADVEACGDNEGLLPVNRQFAKLLRERGLTSEFHSGPGGHNWYQWNGRLDDVFAALKRKM